MQFLLEYPLSFVATEKADKVLSVNRAMIRDRNLRTANKNRTDQNRAADTHYPTFYRL
jgi:hypothetical protein